MDGSGRKSRGVGGTDRVVFLDAYGLLYSKRTDWLLGLDKVSLRLVANFFTGHCEIRPLTRS